MTRIPLPRPTLIPGLARLWRGPRELQIGLDPTHAVLLQLPDPGAARVLDLLDGQRPERILLLRAAELGVPPADTCALIDALRAAGLVVPAASLLPTTLPASARRRLTGEAAALAIAAAGQARRQGAPSADLAPARVLRRRSAARVVLSGHGRLGAPLAVALAEAGVGHVLADLTGAVDPTDLAGSPLLPSDVGAPRHLAVAAAVQRAAPGVETSRVRRTPATLVVQLAHDQPTAVIATAHAARRQPHLAVTTRDGVAIVGPFVPAAGSPCLNCLDLHRRERDADWPGFSAPDGAEPMAVATVLAATAYATAEALVFLDGGVPETLGGAMEIAGPGRFRRRTWPPHPDCDCHRRRRT